MASALKEIEQGDTGWLRKSRYEEEIQDVELTGASWRKVQGQRHRKKLSVFRNRKDGMAATKDGMVSG